jgi:hypothetical protein
MPGPVGQEIPGGQQVAEHGRTPPLRQSPLPKNRGACGTLAKTFVSDLYFAAETTLNRTTKYKELKN